MTRFPRVRAVIKSIVLLTATTVAACSDPTASQPLSSVKNEASVIFGTTCVGSTVTGMLSCGKLQVPNINADVIGGQGVYVTLASSNVSYDPDTETFQFDVTIQNLLNEAIGTPDGTVADPEGIQIFFNSGPVVTGGVGTISVANADGTGTFTAAGQPYFSYPVILAKNEVSPVKTWKLSIPATVETFAFSVYMETERQYLLKINEVLVNPANAASPTVTDATGEWFEVYNAGSLKVNMKDLVIADSAASGRRPYHLISSDLEVQPGGYVVLGATTNTLSNGGVPVDYAYGSALQLANSLDAIKISRVFGTDSLTINRTQYSNASVSAQDGISRELKNPLLDNSNMDGSNWAGALVTAVYGVGGRGTPKAQNSVFEP